MKAKDIIRLLNLEPLPMEGGYYRETYRSDERLDTGLLPGRPGEWKELSTAIWYMLTPDTMSGMHRLPSDEVFHFYSGDPVEMLVLYPDGSGEIVVLGADLEKRQLPQYVIKRGTWFGARLIDGGEYALMGTTVAPAFDFEDFESGDRAELTDGYPEWSEKIRMLT